MVILRARFKVVCVGVGVLVMGLLDVPPSAAQGTTAPAVLFTDVLTGPTTGGPNNLGVPIAIFGSGFGTTRGASTVTIGDVPVAAYLAWGANNALNPTLDMIVVQPGIAVSGGPVVVTVGGLQSNADVSFTANAGRIRYVSATGSDTAPCTEPAPCATITRAIEPSITGPGDTILVRGPVHPEGEVWVRREYGHGGTAEQPKTIKAYPGDNVTFSNGSRPFIVDADYVTVAGFQFQNGKSLGIPDAGDINRRRGNRFINNKLTGPVSWAFIDSHGDGHLIAGNMCDATASSVGTQGHCYYISYGDGVRVAHNIGGGTPGYGIHVFDQRRSSTDFRRVISDLIVEGNIVRNSTERSGLILSMGDEANLGNVIDGVIVRNNVLTGNNHLGLTMGGNVRNVKVYNNTFYENGRQGVHIGSGSLLTTIDVRNNLFVQSANSVCQSNCSWYPVAHAQVAAAAPAVTVRNNGYFPDAAVLVGATDSRLVSGVVALANPAMLDFHVNSGSSSIDRGEALAEVPVDYGGVPRPSGPAYDLGAFEQPATPRRAPAAPHNLRFVR